MRCVFGVLIFVLAIASLTFAQESQPAAWSSHRAVAGHLSDALVASQYGLAAWDAWKSDRRADEFKQLGCRTIAVLGIVEPLKHLTHRLRPDGSDRLSFPSGHTANAISQSGWNYQISIPIAIGAGYMRAAANKHYASDIAVGAAVGLIAQRVCR